MKITNIKYKAIKTFAALALAATTAFSQGAEPTPPQQPAPLELPTFIIEGVEQTNVMSGIKQMPEKPARLSLGMLDSINSLEKQPAPLIAPDTLPERSVIRTYRKGFFSGEFGRYMTPSLQAGMGMNWQGYELYATGGMEVSDGHIKNADYSKFNLLVNSDYIADDKYWIFGGSRTRTTLKIDNQNFKLYKASSAPERSSTDFDLSVNVDGAYEGAQFYTGAGISSLQINSDKSAAFDNRLNGYLKIQNYWDNYLIGGNLDIDFHNIRGDGISFITLDGAISYFDEKFSALGSAGFQFANNSMGERRSGLLLGATAEYRISGLFTVAGRLHSGMEKRTLDDYYQMNPYLFHSSDIDFEYDILSLRGAITYHPTRAVSITGGALAGRSDRSPYFADRDSATFDIKYANANRFGLFLEGTFEMGESDALTFNANFENKTITSSSKEFPYSEPLRASLDYHRAWSENFGTYFGVYYVNARYIDDQNLREIDGFTNIRARADWKFAETMSMFVRVDNLLNSNIVIWNGYKQRDMFFAAGLLWQF